MHIRTVKDLCQARAWWHISVLNPRVFLTPKVSQPNFGSASACGGGDDGIRTHDPLLAGQVLSQLSYTPIDRMRFDAIYRFRFT